MAVFCESCGSQLDAGARFCRGCGRALAETASAVPFPGSYRVAAYARLEKTNTWRLVARMPVALTP